MPAEQPRTTRTRLNLDPKRHPRPRVLVLDTGLCVNEELKPQFADLWKSIHIHDKWRTHRGPDSADDDDEADVNDDGALELQAGHGTFVAGLVQQVCPDAEIHIDGVLSSYGMGDDITVGRGLHRAALRAKRDGFDLIVMSLGAYTIDDEPPPLARWIDKHAGDALVVAAAGNAGSSRPMWPAALDGVVGVGALDQAGRAAFSNFGGWVDACAPGVDVVSTFFDGFDDTFGNAWTDGGEGAITRHFRGWARWTGTSFSAPKVAGAIAQEMYLHGGSAREAWGRVGHWSKLRVPDIGVVVNA